VNSMKVGVFDSGVGGLAVAKAVQKALPDYEVIYRNDKQHVPYGTRTPEEILSFVVPIFQGMVDEGCEAIVVACNTVSTTLISQLRERFSIPLVAMEPMVKPAAAKTKTGVIAVCATPATLASARYKWLKDTYAQGVKVIEPDCSDWATMIEHDNVEESKVRDRIEEACDEGADVIVLGCTHYHWIEDLIQGIAAKRAVVVQPERPVIKQLKRVLGLPE
jgi:glutamate racemase